VLECVGTTGQRSRGGANDSIQIKGAEPVSDALDRKVILIVVNRFLIEQTVSINA